jgi:hypothetical protein
MRQAEPRAYFNPAPPARNSSFAGLRRAAKYIPSYLAGTIGKPEWLVMFALGRVMPVRRAYRKLQPAVPPAPVAGPTIFDRVDPADVLAAIRTDGIFPGLSLPDKAVREIREFAATTPCFGNMDRRLEFWAQDHVTAERRFGRPLLTGQYFDRIEGCPAIAAVRRDALVHTVARAYLGPCARLAATRLWWRFPAEANERDHRMAPRERFHFDLDDWQTLRFLFYLTPDDRDASPHVYIRGSHRERRWKHQLTPLAGHPIHEVVAAYGVENILSVSGGSGFGLAEDPFGFHKGAAPRRTPHLMMELAFGVSTASRRRFYGEPAIAPE